MTLSGVLVKQVTIKSGGDVFHELFSYKPHLVPEMSPHCIKGVDLHDGEWGVVGCIIIWSYMLDGKEIVGKDVIEAIDEEKKLVCLKVIGGDILESYKSFSFTIQVDTKGEENMVTWTIHYEKLNESVDDPESMMDLCLNITKDIENHHLARSN